MSDSLKVQRDDLAQVVRVLSGDGPTELTADQAQSIGEELIRAGRELETEQTTIDAEPEQTTLDEQDDDTESLHEMLDRIQSDDDRQTPEIGGVLNQNNPAEW